MQDQLISMFVTVALLLFLLLWALLIDFLLHLRKGTPLTPELRSVERRRRASYQDAVEQ